MVDCDGKGSSYPELQMNSYYINGLLATPVAAADEKGNTFICTRVAENKSKNVEDFLRSNVVNYGCFFGIALNPQTKDEIMKYGVRNSISRAWRLGKAIFESRKEKTDPMIAI